jgi:hypothetical protein
MVALLSSKRHRPPQPGRLFKVETELELLRPDPTTKGVQTQADASVCDASAWDGAFLLL